MKAPNPSNGWRLLKVGDNVPAMSDVEYQNHNGGWTHSAFSRDVKDDVFDGGNGSVYRIRGGAKPAKGINFQRLALRMSKAKTIREARELYKKAVGK